MKSDVKKGSSGANWRMHSTVEQSLWLEERQKCVLMDIPLEQSCNFNYFIINQQYTNNNCQPKAITRML